MFTVSYTILTVLSLLSLYIFQFTEVLQRNMCYQHQYAFISYIYSSHYVLFEWIILKYFLKLKVIFYEDSQNSLPLLSSPSLLAIITSGQNRWNLLSLQSFVSTTPIISDAFSLNGFLNFNSLLFINNPTWFCINFNLTFPSFQINDLSEVLVGLIHPFVLFDSSCFLSFW